MSKSRSRQPSRGGGGGQGSVRLIAGSWRGRRLSVLDEPGLRPTGDRVRETLFNWLQLDIPGARCLDVFAGSGALGIEAASRGAREVVMVESNQRVAQALRQQLEVLDAGPDLQVAESPAEQFLLAPFEPFDVVFIDPPFTAKSQLVTLTALLAAQPAHPVTVYIEAAATDFKDALFSVNICMPEGVEVRRERQFGDVCATLVDYSPPQPS